MSGTYGEILPLEQARRIADAGEQAARAGGYTMSFAIVEPSGELIPFHKMGAAQYGAGAVAQEKARTAARFRRSTKASFDAIAGGRTPTLSVPGIAATEGGVPIVMDGQVVGGLGVSGGTAEEDGQIAAAALATPQRRAGCQSLEVWGRTGKRGRVAGCSRTSDCAQSPNSPALSQAARFLIRRSEAGEGQQAAHEQRISRPLDAAGGGLAWPQGAVANQIVCIGPLPFSRARTRISSTAKPPCFRRRVKAASGAADQMARMPPGFRAARALRRPPVV